MITRTLSVMTFDSVGTYPVQISRFRDDTVSMWDSVEVVLF